MGATHDEAFEKILKEFENKRVSKEKKFERRWIFVNISYLMLFITIMLSQYLLHHEVYQFTTIKICQAKIPNKTCNNFVCYTEKDPLKMKDCTDTAAVDSYYKNEKIDLWPVGTYATGKYASESYAFLEPWVQLDLVVTTVFISGLTTLTTMRMNKVTMISAIVCLQICLLIEIYFAWFWFRNREEFELYQWMPVVWALMLVRTCIHTYDTTTTQVRIR